jgi:NADH dehydrogenase
VKQSQGETLDRPFKYLDLGSVAVIGDNEAVADLGFIKFSGFLAWFAWIIVHIYFLIQFDSKLVVMLQWAWNYFTTNRGARIITKTSLQPDEPPIVKEDTVPAVVS